MGPRDAFLCKHSARASIGDKKIPDFCDFPLSRNSDIWRDFPRFIIPLFAMAYLNVRQGCRTTVAGAVCDFEQMKFSPHDHAVYLQPYLQLTSMSVDRPLFPLFEMLGVFGGHLKARPRLPSHDGGSQAAKALWQACVEMSPSVQWPEPQS